MTDIIEEIIQMNAYMLDRNFIKPERHWVTGVQFDLILSKLSIITPPRALVQAERDGRILLDGVIIFRLTYGSDGMLEHDCQFDDLCWCDPDMAIDDQSQTYIITHKKPN